MKLKILCPCDFSLVALQGAEFAGLIANRIDAEITLFYVQPSVWPEAIFQEPEVEESMEYIESRLALISENISLNFKIECTHELLRTTDAIDHCIAMLSSRFDLIVMGTNGIDDIFDYLFGTNSFHVSKLANCPVLLIPENQKMEIPDTMIYLHNQNINSNLDIYTPLWWSVWLDTNFGIWLTGSGDKSTDQVERNQVILNLMDDHQEKFVSFVEIIQDIETIDTKGRILYAMPFDKLHFSRNKEGRSLLKKFSKTATNPIFIYAVE